MLDLLMIYRLQAAGLCLTLLIAIPYFLTKHDNKYVHKIFSWLIIFQILSLAGDIATVYTVNNLDTVPGIVNDILHTFFIISLFLFIYTTFLYIRHLVTEDESTKNIFIYGIPVILSIIVLLFTEIEYVETEHGNYSAGLGAYCVYTIIAVYLICMLYLLLRNNHVINAEKRRVLLIAVITELLVSGVQLFIPTILISSLGTTIIVVAIFLTLENPDRILRDMYHKAYKKTKQQSKTILESINYAGQIQRNLLPPDDLLHETFSDISVLWKPRDVVGGDIYWIRIFDKGVTLCVADCTGHGIPGAMLTMLVVSTLESIVRTANCDDTADIMYRLDRRLSTVLHVKDSSKIKKEMTDIGNGCDAAVFFIGQDGSVKFSSGNISVFTCLGDKIRQYKGQRIFVGEGRLQSKDDIEVIEIPEGPECSYYVASDGLFDQKGGENGKPFGYSAFKQIILENRDKPFSATTEKVWNAFESYRGANERRDDVALMAFRPKPDFCGGVYVPD